VTPEVASAKAVAICGIALAALWCGTVALADGTPTPSPTTTTTDAPPPDPYTPPARESTKKRTAPVTHRPVTASPSAPTPARTYVQPSGTYVQPSRAYVQPATTTRVVRASRAKASRKAQKPGVRKRARPQTVSLKLAPVTALFAAVDAPLPDEDDPPYLWLAGVAFALLAVAGLAVVSVALRSLKADGQFK
jgi:hypothetical protein